ncbi:hypothetical protein M8818_001779 [Zalaria obscura]|uniref:Uncharacterized protein n=1 Tax=Zalaria obscura TaxID=2024903 RepID=A0ACC3SJR6_9PEZI
MAGNQDPADARHRYAAPNTKSKKIPTIQGYREEKENRKAHADAVDLDGSSQEQQDPDAATQYLTEGDSTAQNTQADSAQNDNSSADATSEHGKVELSGDTSEDAVTHLDPKQRRKAMGKRKGERAEREVTDPVTHLPIRIHDLQSSDIKEAPENEAPPGTDSRTATGLSNKSKTDSQLEEEQKENQVNHLSMEKLFPPPEYDRIRSGLTKLYTLSITVGLSVLSAIGITIFALLHFAAAPDSLSFILGTGHSWRRFSLTCILISIGVGLGVLTIICIRSMLDHRVNSLWENEVWEAAREQAKTQSPPNETTQWLNNILKSIWPLINPDLFTSLADTLEDVMQASLPRVVRMISIEDIGQGSESIRILGVRWLPTGAAARTVNQDGKLEDPKSGSGNDRTVPGEGEVSDSSDKSGGGQDSKPDSGNEQEQEQEAEGMEAEEGDFINLEVAFAYRSRSSERKFGDRAKHMHAFMAFYLPGRIKVPIYVDLRGIVGVMRMRLQLTPDPPFFSLCTITLLGQPKAEISCIPLTQKGLNVMDLPLISKFISSSVDAALAEYVAPKSLTLDLKDMLAGEDFKKDTRARGVIIARIKRAYDFKTGDPSIPMIKEGSADPYVSVGWAKFAKPLWSTRVILSEMDPHWEETCFILVTPDELNVDERLRVQLWDSDRFSPDDDLGRIEIDLKKLMHGKETNGKMMDREDGFKALKADETMPGKLEWSVGYFGKTHAQDIQLHDQQEEPGLQNTQQLKERVKEVSQKKLREAKKDETKELGQLEAQEYKAAEDRIIIAARPLTDYPAGILSIQIHEATGLELSTPHYQDRDNNKAPDETEVDDELPSCYCNVIINHQMVYKTRVKPKNAKPFFNAGTERFIRDWPTTEVIVSVRDARVHEDDALLGLVRLPLCEVFQKRSQVMNTYPVSGGLGYGRIRISMVFRSVTCQIPRSFAAWEIGALAIDPKITGHNLSPDLTKKRLKLQTILTASHMSANEENHWVSRRQKKIHLAVRNRLSSCLVIQFRKDTHFIDKTAAFAVFWLRDVLPDEEMTLELPVWKGDLKRATTCYIEECGERVGTIKVSLRYENGIGRYHGKYASQNKHIRAVMETVTEARHQAQRDKKEEKEALRDIRPDSSTGVDSAESEDSSDTGSEDEAGDGDGYSDGDGGGKNGHGRLDNVDSDGKQNLLDRMRDYRDHRHDEHRNHRGVMHFKSARTMWWMKHKASHAQARLQGVFNHHERQTNVESEA